MFIELDIPLIAVSALSEMKIFSLKAERGHSKNPFL